MGRLRTRVYSKVQCRQQQHRYNTGSPQGVLGSRVEVEKREERLIAHTLTASVHVLRQWTNQHACVQRKWVSSVAAPPTAAVSSSAAPTIPDSHTRASAGQVRPLHEQLRRKIASSQRRDGRPTHEEDAHGQRLQRLALRASPLPEAAAT